MKKCEINKKLLPMKMHYFLAGAGFSGVMPFIPVLAKQLGISATGVGIVFTVALFIGLLAKPLFGIIADHFKKLKWMMVIFTFILLIFMYSINLIPYEESISRAVFSSILSCDSASGVRLRPSHPKEPCLESPKLFDDPIECTADCTICNDSTLCDNRTVFSTFLIDPNETVTEVADQVDSVARYFPLLNYSNLEFEVCNNDSFYTCRSKCESEHFDCLSEFSRPSVYTTYRFWLLFTFYVTSYMLASVVNSLSDAACYEMLGGKSKKYGRQRLWGTVGWGFFSLVSGYLMTYKTGDSSVVDYSPGFYIMLVILIIDMIVISLTDIKSSARSESIIRDVGRLLKRLQILMFLLSVFTVGVLTALQWTFLFWYLKDLGASPLLLGLSLTVQCFLGELPTFIFSGLIVQKIGHVNSISIAFAAYAIRFLWYSLIWDPWYVLPVEIMHGATFGLFYTAMTSYAKLVSPAGTEATMQGLVGATFECLGVAVGNLIGGVAFDYYGGRFTYRVAGIIGVICCLLNLLVHIPNRRKEFPDGTEAIKEGEVAANGIVEPAEKLDEKETFLDPDHLIARGESSQV